MGGFPHNLGLSPSTICQDLYPQSSELALVPHQRQSVHAGGWIGLGPSALVVLKELVNKEQSHRDQDAHCHSWGTDQLLGNVAYLHSPNRIGLDANNHIFATGVQEDTSKLSLHLMTSRDDWQGYCDANNLCPSLLQFSNEDQFQTAYEHLRSVPKCQPGQISIVDFMTGSLETLTEEEILTSVFGESLRGTSCFN